MIEEYPKHNSECKSGEHTKHLCYFVSQGFHYTDKEEYRTMTENPQFMCKYCGRVAKSENNLCKPVKL